MNKCTHKPSSHNEPRQQQQRQQQSQNHTRTKKNQTKQHKTSNQMNKIDARTKAFGCIMLTLKKINKTQLSSHNEPQRRQQP